MRVTNWLNRLLGSWRISGATSRRRNSRAGAVQSSRVETLEPRALLSASPVGVEFQVNTTTASDQYPNTTGQGRSVAIDADGDFVVVWTSDGQDGSGTGIFAQRYSADGVAQGSEFQVNTNTVINQVYPTVAMDADGDFVVTWSSADPNTFLWSVYGRRYNAAGVAQGGEFQVNTSTLVDNLGSTVAMDAEGNFVVTWCVYGQDGNIYGRRYDSAGVAQGADFQVNTTMNSLPYYRQWRGTPTETSLSSG